MNKYIPGWINEFEEGMEDAMNSYPPKINKNDDYYSGYNYGLEFKEDTKNE